MVVLLILILVSLCFTVLVFTTVVTVFLSLPLCCFFELLNALGHVDQILSPKRRATQAKILQIQVMTVEIFRLNMEQKGHMV